MKTTSLTPKQIETLEFIRTYTAKNGAAPTLKEIASALNLDSLRSVTQRIEALERKGFIRRDRFQHRSLSIVEPSSLSVSGTIQVPVIASAGCDAAEVYAQERFGEYLTVDMKLLAGGKDIVAIKAVGNSMVDAGINNGDYVLVEATSNVSDGDRVVALVGDMAVIKRLKKAGDKYILNPENETGGYSPIIVQQEDARIFGRVLSVISSGHSENEDVEFVYDEGYREPIKTFSREEMVEIISRELDSMLPRISNNLHHNMVRMAYNALRRHDLSKTNPEGPEAVLRKAYEAIQGTVTEQR